MARYVRVTPRKARRVVDMIRGMPAEEAQAVLSFAPQAASTPVRKVLASAVANAGQAGGPDAGGNHVKIYGSGFTGATGVKFGGVAVAANNFTVLHDWVITATVSPPGT